MEPGEDVVVGRGLATPVLPPQSRVAVGCWVKWAINPCWHCGSVPMPWKLIVLCDNSCMGKVPVEKFSNKGIPRKATSDPKQFHPLVRKPPSSIGNAWLYLCHIARRRVGERDQRGFSS